MYKHQLRVTGPSRWHASDVLVAEVSGLTSILDIQLGVNELISLEDLSQATPLVPRLVSAFGTAKGQVVVVVRFLGVVVRPHFVHPEPDRLANIVLQQEV